MSAPAPVAVEIVVNGTRRRAVVEPRTTLVDFLRDHLGLTGTHVGCEHGICGACSVLLDGDPVRACCAFAVQVDGMSVTTVEGLAPARGQLSKLQDAFVARNACQCGYCTPGMLIAAADLLKSNPQPSREAIREHLAGNYCRCTGYHAIVDAVEAAARTSNGKGGT